MDTGNQFLGTERVSKLMKQYAIPCIISLLVGALYNIVDQIFIANASYLGSYGNAANTVVFPLTVVALAIAVMIGDGCCAFVSMALGRNELEKAKRSVGNSVVLSVATSLVLMAVYFIFANSIIAMFGGTVNEETFHHSQEYFFYITLGIPFYMFGQSMISTLSGAVINIILDPIFIFCFKWGMMGAAVATVIGQVLTAVLAVWYLMNMKVIKPASGDYVLHRSICGRMLTLGITSFLSQISLVAAMAAINNMLRKYGALDAVFGQEQYAQIPMAVVGIVMKFFQIVISIVVGMAAGCIPIVGYNMGAKKELRVRELFTRLLLTEALVGCVKLVQNKEPPARLLPAGVFSYSPIVSGTSSVVTFLSLAINFNGKNGQCLYVSYLSPSLHIKQFDFVQFLFANSAAASLFIILSPLHFDFSWVNCVSGAVVFYC